MEESGTKIKAKQISNIKENRRGRTYTRDIFVWESMFFTVKIKMYHLYQIEKSSHRYFSLFQELQELINDFCHPNENAGLLVNLLKC